LHTPQFHFSIGTVGPNRLFDFAVNLAAARGYDFMMQLELDVVPLRRLWLEKLSCLAQV